MSDSNNPIGDEIPEPTGTPIVPAGTVDTRVKGMDLTANLGSLTTNMVAIACQHKNDFASSSAINNFKKDLMIYTSVKIVGAQDPDIENLNTNNGGLSDAVKCHVLDSGENRNLTESPDKLNSAKLFALIKSAIASDTDVSTGIVRSSKRDDIVALQQKLTTELLGEGIKLKFAAMKNACTQLVFGFELEGNEVTRVVGRIQSVGSGLTGDVQTGDFNMEIEGDKYVISAGKDSAPMITTLLKKILGLKKEIEVKEPEKPAPANPAAGAGGDPANLEGNLEGNPTPGGGKTKHRRHKKKGTRKHKPKRTMKKRKSSRRRSSKK